MSTSNDDIELAGVNNRRGPPTAATPPTTSSGCGDFILMCCGCTYIMLTVASVFVIIFAFTSSNPTLKLERLTVSPHDIVDDTNHINYSLLTMTGKWDIGVSLKNPNIFRTISYKNVGVWIKQTTFRTTTTESYSSYGAYFPINNFLQGRKNTTLLNVTLDASTPQFVVSRTFDGGLSLEKFDVIIEAGVKVALWGVSFGRSDRCWLCRDMNIRIPANATQWTLGVPLSCSPDFLYDHFY